MRAAGARRVAVAAYLLVDGLFYRSLYRAGADAITAPLATRRNAVVDLVLDRYDDMLCRRRASDLRCPT